MATKQETFDMFANTALRVYLEVYPDISVDTICEQSCMVADKMMLERADWGSDGNGPHVPKDSYPGDK